MLDWTRIDTVLLDMDGTLLDLYFDNHFWLEHVPRHYAERNALSLDDARTQLYDRFRAEQGTLNWYCVDFWSRELGVDIATLKHDTRALIAIRPAVPEFLAAVRQSGRGCWLVTNAHHKSLALKLDHTGIGSWFDRVVCSHDYQAPKESAAFWRQLEQREGVDTHRALLVDDSQAVLAAAADYGVGQLLTIAQPDSRQPSRIGLAFPALHSFHDLLPIPAR